MSDYRTPAEWAEHQGLTIIDPDGWRAGSHVYGLKPKAFDRKITQKEFNKRVMVSTIMIDP